MGRKRKAEKQKEKEDDDGEFIVEYIVQAIPDSAESDDGWSYNVHWYGYSDDQNTWEPSSNLVGCERLVKSFWNQFPEHKRYKDQEAAISAQEWIQKEIQYCARNVKKKYNAKKPRLDSASTASTPPASTSKLAARLGRGISKDSELTQVPESPRVAAPQAVTRAKTDSESEAEPETAAPSSLTHPEQDNMSTSNLAAKKRRTPGKPKVNTDEPPSLYVYETASDDNDGNNDGVVATGSDDEPLAKRRAGANVPLTMQSQTAGKPRGGAPLGARSMKGKAPASPARKNSNTTTIVRKVSAVDTPATRKGPDANIALSSTAPAAPTKNALPSFKKVKQASTPTAAHQPAAHPDPKAATSSHSIVPQTQQLHTFIAAAPSISQPEQDAPAVNNDDDDDSDMHSLFSEAGSDVPPSADVAPVSSTTAPLASNTAAPLPKVPAHRAPRSRIQLMTSVALNGSEPSPTAMHTVRADIARRFWTNPVLASPVDSVGRRGSVLSESAAASPAAGSPQISVASPLGTVVSPPEEHAQEDDFVFGNDDVPMSITPPPMSPTISPAQSNQSAYIPPPANGSNAVPTSYDATPSSVPPIQSQQTLDADQFLASLFVEKPVPAPFVYSASLVSTTPSVTYRIPKKGSWEGALQLGMADGSSPPVFRVRIQEIATLRFDGNSQRLFSSCMAERQTLLLHKTFPASYLNFFFPALRLRVWAKMELAPGSQEDMPVFNGFLRHIEANHLFSLSAIPPKSDSDKINTHALVFHNSNVHLAKKLNLHQELASGETSNRGSPDPFLVFALLFPNADHPSPDPPRNGEKAQTATELWSDARRELNLLSEDLLKRTPNVQVDQLQLPGLEIPGNLLRFIHNQSYSVFERGHESAGVSVSQETRQLVRMLNRAGAKKMRTKDPALVIFIHLEHFRHLHSFPGLHHRRQSTSVQFWLYGTSPFYPPRLQGSSVIPVFPKGGVVTFTARIVAEKPTESQALISKINSHPDWVCYVIPEVVGLLQDMVTTEDTGAYKTKDFADPVTAVLALVKPYLEQQISVMRHPPPRWDDEAVVNWEVDLMTISDLIPPAHDDLDILDYCGKILDNHQVPTVERERFVYDLMLKDLRQMEATPAVHCNYRRFVIIVSDNFEQQPWLEIGGAGEDGFEKLAIDKFMFRDGFDPWMSS